MGGEQASSSQLLRLLLPPDLRVCHLR
jgi:hypothetical protein